MKGLVFVREVDFDSVPDLWCVQGQQRDDLWHQLAPCVCVSASVVTVASAVTSFLSDALPSVKKQ